MKKHHAGPIGKRSPRPRFKSPSPQSGQIIVEYLLLLVIVVGLSFTIQRYLQSDNFIQTFTFKPWAKLDGMIQCGSWSQCGFNNPTKDYHSQAATRVLSLDPSK